MVGVAGLIIKLHECVSVSCSVYPRTIRRSFVLFEALPDIPDVKSRAVRIPPELADIRRLASGKSKDAEHHVRAQGKRIEGRCVFFRSDALA